MQRETSRVKKRRVENVAKNARNKRPSIVLQPKLQQKKVLAFFHGRGRVGLFAALTTKRKTVAKEPIVL